MRSRYQQLTFQVIAVALTGGAFAALRAFDLLGPDPLWVILLLLVGASVVGQVATAVWGPHCTRAQLHARTAIHMAVTTVIIYVTGWGPTLALGYLVPVAGELDLSGSAAYVPALGWATAAIAAGQVGIAVGLFPTQVHEPLVHGLAALAALGLGFVIYLLGTKTRDIDQAGADLRASNDAMREFVAVASHELRTPTTVVKGFASTLQMHWDTIGERDRRDFIAAILRSADHLTELIDDLLTVSTIDAGVVEPHLEPVPVIDAINLSLDDVPDIVVDVRAPDDLVVEADPEHLRRILRNYVENAAHYGHAPYEVEAVAVNGVVEIRVRDHGEGLPDDFADRAFDKFARATPGPEGTGLGLSIVRGLAEAGGGRAWYEPGDGSCFAVSFPQTSAS